jgi:hypothetical protein
MNANDLGMTKHEMATYISERKRQRKQAADNKWWEEQEARRHDPAGARAGRRAADSVDLSGGRSGVSQARQGELS